jgi:hypothetical protein
MQMYLKEKAKRVACGLGMGALVAFPVITMLPAAAHADTCYTGCTSPSSGVSSTDGTGSASVSPTTSSNTLAFTGADLGELALIGLGAVGAGTVLVRRSRRRTA